MTKAPAGAGAQIVDKVVSASKSWSHFVLSNKQIQQSLQKVAETNKKRGITSQYLGQFLEIYTREC